LCLLAISGLLAAAHSAPAPDEKPGVGNPVVPNLLKEVKFEGYDDPKTTLQEALEHLSDRFDLAIDVNEEAFKAAGMDDVFRFVVAGERPLPKANNVRVERVLRKVLSRLPVQSGATFLVRRGRIEVTTLAAARAEVLGDSDRELPPLVQAAFEKRPLEAALRELGEWTEDLNIVLDGRAADKAKTPVTARFTNAPIDTAVRLLADMAELKVVRMDNVLYVTSKENADRIRAEQDKDAETGRPDQGRPPARNRDGAGM
jgi:hypothetical protein